MRGTQPPHLGWRLPASVALVVASVALSRSPRSRVAAPSAGRPRRPTAAPVSGPTAKAASRKFRHHRTARCTTTSPAGYRGAAAGCRLPAAKGARDNKKVTSM